MDGESKQGAPCRDSWTSSFTDPRGHKMAVEEFCRRMPKIELHAHLSGSVPDNVVQQLLEAASSGSVGVRPSVVEPTSFSDSGTKTSDGRLPAQEEVNLTKASDKSLYSESQFTIEKNGRRRTMEECFSVFKALHCAISSLAALSIATRAVLDAFHQENVLYLELRSTPRAFAGSSKRDYMDTLVETVAAWQRELQSAMEVRLVVSLDRGRPLADAEENLQVALQMVMEQQESGGDGLLVGVDVSGDPSKGDLGDLLPLMLRAKEMGLGVLLHACEVLNDRCHSEALAVLRQVPVDRLGHGTYLHCNKLEQYFGSRTVNTENSDDGAPAAASVTEKNSEDDGSGGCSNEIRALEQLVRQQKVPIEACLSSNLCSGTCPAADQHHFRRWFLESDHPVCVCTDDRGVFQTSLSEEFAALTKAFSLVPRQLQQLVENAASASLLPTLHKERLLNRVHTKFSSLMEQ